MKSNIFGNILKTKDLIIVYQMVLFLDQFLLILQIFNWDTAFSSKTFWSLQIKSKLLFLAPRASCIAPTTALSFLSCMYQYIPAYITRLHTSHPTWPRTPSEDSCFTGQWTHQNPSLPQFCTHLSMTSFLLSTTWVLLLLQWTSAHHSVYGCDKEL